MKIKIEYEILGKEGLGRYATCIVSTKKRIRSNKDKEIFEKAICKSQGYDKINIFNWKIIGSMYDKMG